MKFLQTDISDLEFDEKDFLQIIIKENSELTIENVTQHFETVRLFTESKKVICLLDLTKIKFTHISSEVLNYMANNSYDQYQKAVALIIEGLGQKILGNFYLRVVKPKVQTKMFTDKNEGVNWLKKMAKIY